MKSRTSSTERMSPPGPLAGIGAAVGAGIALFFSTSLQALAVCGELSYTTEAYRLNGNTLSGLTQNVCSSGTVLPPLELGQIGLNMLVLAVIGGLIGAGIGDHRRDQTIASCDRVHARAE